MRKDSGVGVSDTRLEALRVAPERLNGFNLWDRRVLFRNSLSGGWVSRALLNYSPSVGAVNIFVKE